ncbi:hypothetical protein B0H10DRAFT_2297771 [Mycena sp. CBHHK59/15]|nr:hypothetical protein B0H10DRAFT_2297771 [Mycena sp. CBHHK59/15]
MHMDRRTEIERGSDSALGRRRHRCRYAHDVDSERAAACSLVHATSRLPRPSDLRLFPRFPVVMLDEKASASTSNDSPHRTASDTMVIDQTSTNVDLENAILDPFHFRGSLKTPAQIDELRRRKKGKRLASYHGKQNRLIASLLKPMEEHTEDARVDEAAARLPNSVRGYFIVVLVITGNRHRRDFDIGSNILLFWLHKKADELDSNAWPVGGARMGSVNLVVIVESTQSLITKKNDDLKTFHLPSILAVAAALGILMSTGGSKLVWWLDPMGAIIIALGVVISWGRTIYSQFELLAGKSASHDFLQLLIYKSMTFSQEIDKLDTVRAYHSGPDYFVEIDIVMDANTPLWKAHDVSQALQDRIEVLPNVERAFVHVDYETTHTPEHRKTVVPHNELS